MAYERTDLLSFTRGMLRLAQGVTVILMVCAVVILIGSTLLHGAGKPMPSFTGSLSRMEPTEALNAVRLAAIVALVSSALLLPMLREVLRLIDSARIGDPFIPENARRLRRIGWLLLAINICISLALAPDFRGSISFPPVSFSGLLTVLLVFVLARIFETGSQMRAELKETV